MPFFDKYYFCKHQKYLFSIISIQFEIAQRKVLLTTESMVDDSFFLFFFLGIPH